MVAGASADTAGLARGVPSQHGVDHGPEQEDEPREVQPCDDDDNAAEEAPSPPAGEREVHLEHRLKRRPPDSREGGAREDVVPLDVRVGEAVVHREERNDQPDDQNERREEADEREYVRQRGEDGRDTDRR